MKKMFVFIMMVMLIAVMTGCSKNNDVVDNNISWNGEENVITEKNIEENVLIEEIEVKEIEVKEIETKTI